MERFRKCVVISQKKDHYKVDILRRDDSAVEILDPNDFSVRTLSVAYDISTDDTKVRICLIEGEWTCMPVREANSEGNKMESDPTMIELAETLDPSDMIGWTTKFPNALRFALTKDLGLDIENDWSGILCLGVGGSGAGGMLLSDISNEKVVFLL